MVVVFLDELTTVPPTTQAAGGQEIQAPMANRLWHGEFPMDHETWCEMMVSDFPAPSSLPVLPADYLRTHHHRQRALIAAYVKAVGRAARRQS